MPRHEVTAERRGTSDLYLNSNGQAWSMQLPVGDQLYATALVRAIGRVNDEFRANEADAARQPTTNPEEGEGHPPAGSEGGVPPPSTDPNAPLVPAATTEPPTIETPSGRRRTGVTRG